MPKQHDGSRNCDWCTCYWLIAVFNARFTKHVRARIQHKLFRQVHMIVHLIIDYAYSHLHLYFRCNYKQFKNFSLSGYHRKQPQASNISSSIHPEQAYSIIAFRPTTQLSEHVAVKYILWIKYLCLWVWISCSAPLSIVSPLARTTTCPHSPCYNLSLSLSAAGPSSCPSVLFFLFDDS